MATDKVTTTTTFDPDNFDPDTYSWYKHPEIDFRTKAPLSEHDCPCCTRLRAALKSQRDPLPEQFGEGLPEGYHYDSDTMCWGIGCTTPPTWVWHRTEAQRQGLIKGTKAKLDMVLKSIRACEKHLPKLEGGTGKHYRRIGAEDEYFQPEAELKPRSRKGKLQPKSAPAPAPAPAAQPKPERLNIRLTCPHCGKLATVSVKVPA
jgi:hypothetical protein